MSINLFESCTVSGINLQIVKVVADALVSGLQKAHLTYQGMIYRNSLTRLASDKTFDYIHKTLTNNNTCINLINAEKESNDWGYDYPLIIDFNNPKPVAILTLSEGSFFEVKNSAEKSTHYAKVLCTANSKVEFNDEPGEQLCWFEDESLDSQANNLYLIEQYESMIAKLGVNIDKTILLLFKRNRNKIVSLSGCLVDAKFNIIQKEDFTKYLPIHNFEETCLPKDMIDLPDKATILSRDNISNVTPKVLIKEK